MCSSSAVSSRLALEPGPAGQSLKEGPGRASGRGTSGPGLEEKGPPGQEGQHQPRHGGCTDAEVQGEGVVEPGPWGTQGLGGGVEGLGLAEPGMGTRQAVSRVGQGLWAGSAVCFRRKDGKLRGTCLGVSRVLRAVSCYSCCVIELLASLHKVTIILPALILTTSSVRFWSTQIREVTLVGTLPSGCF